MTQTSPQAGGITQPSRIYVNHIGGNEWLPTDLALLQRGLGDSYNSMTMEDVQGYLNAGVMTLWRIMGPADGVFLARTIKRPEGMELRICALAGKGIIKHGKAILSQIKIIAQAAGFRWLTCQADNPGAARCYERIGFNPVSITYMIDLEE